jgi:hypothetical protein
VRLPALDGAQLLCAPAGGPVIITAECRLGSALDKAIGPRNDVHADGRPGLYHCVAAEPVTRPARAPS